MISYGSTDQAHGPDQSELDLIAILSSVNEEDITDKPSELTTVDASAITPIKSEPNIISKGRKRKNQTTKQPKKVKETVIEEASTINMQDLA